MSQDREQWGAIFGRSKVLPSTVMQEEEEEEEGGGEEEEEEEEEGGGEGGGGEEEEDIKIQPLTHKDTLFLH